jgi:ABC-type phosphate transport system substrate-binding protein
MSPHIRPAPGICSALGVAIAFGLCATARSDVVAVVSAKSTITVLNKSQAADIFLGKVTRFPGGSAATPIDQEGRLIREQFYAMLVDQSPAQIKAYWSKIIFTGRGRPPQEVADSVEMKKMLAVNPGAIGYLDSHDVDATVRVLF